MITECVWTAASTAIIMTTAEITATKLDVVNIPLSMPLNSSIIVCIYFNRKQLVIHIFIYIHV